MSGTAQIYDAKLEPGKDLIAQKFGGITKLLGSYRLVDRDDEVGIEALIGRDVDGRLIQLPLSYRSGEVHPDHTLTEIEHSVLGHRFVSNALGDPVAVRELIRTIVTADDGAAYSNGDQPYLAVQGSGSDYGEDVEVGRVTLTATTGQSAEGIVTINSRVRSFGLRAPRILAPENSSGPDYEGTRLHLAAPDPEESSRSLRIAELYWRDMSV